MCSTTHSRRPTSSSCLWRVFQLHHEKPRVTSPAAWVAPGLPRSTLYFIPRLFPPQNYRLTFMEKKKISFFQDELFLRLRNHHHCIIDIQRQQTLTSRRYSTCASLFMLRTDTTHTTWCTIQQWPITWWTHKQPVQVPTFYHELTHKHRHAIFITRIRKKKKNGPPGWNNHVWTSTTSLLSRASGKMAGAL